MNGDTIIIVLALLLAIGLVASVLIMLFVPRGLTNKLAVFSASDRLGRDRLLEIEVHVPAHGQQLTALYVRRSYDNKPRLCLVDTEQLFDRGQA